MQIEEQASDCAVAIADRLRGADGFVVLNDVVLNQVLVRYRSPDHTARLATAIQHDGRIWAGTTTWNGETALRVSVSSWKTTLDDARRDADIIIDCARGLTG